MKSICSSFCLSFAGLGLNMNFVFGVAETVCICESIVGGHDLKLKWTERGYFSMKLRGLLHSFSGNSGILLFEWFLKWQNRRQLRNVSCYSNILSLYFKFKLDEYQILVKIKRHYYRFSILERIPRKRFNSSIFFEVAIRVKTFDCSCKLSHACFRLTKNHSIISITYIPNRHKLRTFNVLIIKKKLDHFGSFCTNDLKP